MKPNSSLWPQRIACITSETTELVFALGAGERIVGVSGYAVRPPEAREKPKVAAFTSIRLDKIREGKPDLILGFSDLQKDIARELVAEGFNIFISNQRTLQETADVILGVWRLIGEEKAAQKIYADFWAELEKLQVIASPPLNQWRAKQSQSLGIASSQPSAAPRNDISLRPRVYFEEWDEPLISGIAWVSELIEFLGGEDVFKEKRRGRNAKDRTVTAEEVLAADPEIIIASWCGKKVNFEKIRSRPGWEKIAALQNNHLYEIKSSDILAPGLSLLLGARQLSEIFQNFSKNAKPETVLKG